MNTEREMMRPVVAIVQARMSSNRLPGKVMSDISGRSMLWHVVNRLRSVRNLDKIVVATSMHPSDDILARWCLDAGVLSYRGPLDDVLARYRGAALAHGARTVVRVTSDCPMIDPLVIERVIEQYLSGREMGEGVDYVGLDSSFPDGLDTEVFSMEALNRAFSEAGLPSEREHVTPYIWKNTESFCVRSMRHSRDLSHMRWTVDDARDLEFVRRVFKGFACPLRVFYFEEIVKFLSKHADLLKINSSTPRNEGYERSLAGDVFSPSPSPSASEVFSRAQPSRAGTLEKG
ncbi:MAG: cytidylyltransferase domain-containing protein [Thermodesulfobacteriota bacterium]